MILSRRLVVVLTLLLIATLAVAAWGVKAWRQQRNRLKPVRGEQEATSLRIGRPPPMPVPHVRGEVPEMDVTEIARNLRIVWTLRWATDGRLFITERPGRLLVLKPGDSRPLAYARLATALGGESGLMGLALHPAFPSEPFLYVMYTARKAGGGVNRISRLRDTPDGGRDEEILLDDIPAARNHNGGALEFGPDGMLYIGTGDAAVPALAQDLQQPSGKILRVAPDGRIPSDNPFPGSPVWAYGFRNVSGLAFHPDTGDLWAATHGPSGVALDEPKHMDSIYIVRKGLNHGWPLQLGVSGDKRFVPPVIFYTERAFPPGGIAFYGANHQSLRGNLFMSTLRSQDVHRMVVADGRTVTRIERWWPDRFGRVRAITHGPDGSLYIGTSNRDGRTPMEFPGSDFIYRLAPRAGARLR